MSVYYVVMHNTTAGQDDTAYKLAANSPMEARAAARRKDFDGRFRVGEAYRPKDFSARYPDWFNQMVNKPAETLDS